MITHIKVFVIALLVAALTMGLFAIQSAQAAPWINTGPFIHNFIIGFRVVLVTEP